MSKSSLYVATLKSTFEYLPDSWGLSGVAEFHYCNTMKELYMEEFPHLWKDSAMRPRLCTIGANDYANKWNEVEFADIAETSLAYLLEKVDTKLAAGAMLNGKAVGIPLAGGNHQLLFYNKDMVAEQPKNFVELLEACRKLKHDYDMEYPIMIPTAACYFILPMLYGYGSPLWSESIAAGSGIERNSLFKTLTLLKQVIYEEKLAPVKWEQVESRQQFQAGKAAFCIGGDWDIAEHIDTFGDKLGISEIPRLERECLSTGNGNYLFISKYATDEVYENAAKACEKILGSEIQRDIVAKLHRFPAAKDMQRDEITMSEIDRINSEVFSKAAILPPLKEVSHMYHVLGNLLEPQVLVQSPIEELTEDAMRKMEDIDTFVEIKK